ncbi:hypothetical protein MAR_022021 [Mya arenaria]|uniref:Ig-like domain-containing protein n=1 Tax=Mya arenaria TaxID=6604 RepID=A0ABY7E9E8_MYAAR|nr:hypothetical protein MAR_022021 [Mya arenaria]
MYSSNQCAYTINASFYFTLCFFVIAGSAHVLPTSCGTLTIIKPTFVNRNVTLKFLPRHGWISNIVWKYALERDVRHKTLKGLEGHVRQIVHHGPYYDTMLLFADRSYNNSRYHIECTNVMMITRSNTVKLHLHDGPVVDIAEELNVEEGRNVSFRCKHSHGNPPQESSVVWTRALNNQHQSTVTFFAVGSGYKESVTKAENDTVILVCVVKSNPKAEISITKGNDILEVKENGSHLTHTIASLSCLDAGLYSCTSAN